MQYVIKYPQIVRPIIEALPERAEFDDTDKDEMARLLDACCHVLSDDIHPSEIKEWLTGFKNGYGCWLDIIQESIEEAEIDDDMRLQLIGSFHMAKSFLFDIEGHNRR